jgi:hypothetical protein
MDESTRTGTVDDLHGAKENVSRSADRATDKLGDAADRAKDSASKAGHDLSDVVEDMIPGDSDRDGH